MSEYNDTNPRSPRDKPCYFCENTEFTWGQAITGGTLDKDKKYIFFHQALPLRTVIFPYMRGAVMFVVISFYLQLTVRINAGRLADGLEG